MSKIFSGKIFLKGVLRKIIDYSVKSKKNEKWIRLVAWEALSKKILQFELRWTWLLLQDKETVVVDSRLSMEGMDIKIIAKDFWHFDLSLTSLL